ncbi:response regulator [Naasia sp. SYSU D00057]|uniref:response regulator n=1 Tax=Naasia sp. SYSU D00057 TaxID=2817380 RepID=UPI001B30EC54|nr:response regulator [Naasia sp. SYSU D00057]
MTAGSIRVVVADDDPFTVSLVAGGLEAQGFSVHTAATVEQAWELVVAEEPHALISDLDFGGGVSAAPLLARAAADYPWMGLVVLTAHRSPELAVDAPGDIPAGAVYLVKSTLRRVEDLGDAVRRSISGDPVPDGTAAAEDTPTVLLTQGQAEVLRMLAAGASTRAVAEHRGTTVRAAETMLTRLYAALGLEVTEQSNPRIDAVRLWQQGRVGVR